MTAYQRGYDDGYNAYDPDYSQQPQVEYLRGYDEGAQVLKDELDSRWEK